MISDLKSMVSLYLQNGWSVVGFLVIGVIIFVAGCSQSLLAYSTDWQNAERC